MERGTSSSPVSNTHSGDASDPPSSPVAHDEKATATATTAVTAVSGTTAGATPLPEAAATAVAGLPRAKKPKRKNKQGKRKLEDGGDADVEAAIQRKQKKVKKKHKIGPGGNDAKASSVAVGPGDGDAGPRKKVRNKKKAGPVAAAAAAAAAAGTVAANAAAMANAGGHPEGGLSAAQIAVNEQMRRVLEEDQYSANGSIVDTDSDEDDHYSYRGETVRMDRMALLSAMRKQFWMERINNGTAPPGAAGPTAGVATAPVVAGAAVDEEDEKGRASRKKKKKGKRETEQRIAAMSVKEVADTVARSVATAVALDHHHDVVGGADAVDLGVEDEFDRDGGSIFGQTTGSSNATWVECDKCKKWRRLRGVVDEKKLPSKWYCSMNKNDPERARCSAPEEEYETPHTPESAADARTRKHLRVWVRRLQCNEAYEARQPTLTRGRKRAVASSSKEPYEWVRCCNPSCGKFRAILRIMDAKTSVIDRTTDGEWYCVMNTWDEKTASCAAPQENLPAINCPTWVSQDEP